MNFFAALSFMALVGVAASFSCYYLPSTQMVTGANLTGTVQQCVGGVTTCTKSVTYITSTIQNVAKSCGNAYTNCTNAALQQSPPSCYQQTGTNNTQCCCDKDSCNSVGGSRPSWAIIAGIVLTALGASAAK